MIAQTLILFAELLLIVVGVAPNVVLMLVILSQKKRDVDIVIILFITVLDLLCSFSFLLESVGNLLASFLQIELLPEHFAGRHASLVLFPATLIGLGLAAILSVVRCMVIVYGSRVENWVVYTLVFLLCFFTLGFNFISYSGNEDFFSEVMLLNTIDPKQVWGWYICFTLIIFSLSPLAIILIYGLIVRHYLFLKHICELRGVKLCGNIYGLVIVLFLYSFVIVPRVTITFSPQI